MRNPSLFYFFENARKSSGFNTKLRRHHRFIIRQGKGTAFPRYPRRKPQQKTAQALRRVHVCQVSILDAQAFYFIGHARHNVSDHHRICHDYFFNNFGGYLCKNNAVINSRSGKKQVWWLNRKSSPKTSSFVSRVAMISLPSIVTL